MTIRTTLAALLAAALAFSGCSSTKASSGTTTDTVSTDTVTDVAGSDTTSTDVTQDTVKADTVKADIGPPTATWGSCQITDQACMQGCVQGSCADQGQACQADTKCTDLQTCFQNCGATPMVLPTQVTPVAQLPGEATDAYCQRVCIIQGGNAAIAEDEAYIDCVIGMCVDCADTGDPTLAASDCKQLCGEQNYCLDAYNACLTDTDCLNTYGCMLSCAQGDTACQTACQKAAAANSVTLLNAFNTCDSKYATTCITP